MFLLFLSSCNQVFFQPKREAIYKLNREEVEYRDLYLKSTDGETIHARHFSSRRDSSKGLVVHFHGNAENLTSHFMHFFWITNEGYDYLIFDYSGYGESEGLPSRRQAIEDGKTVLQYAWDSIPSSRTRFTVIGQSLGGALVVPAVAEWDKQANIDLLLLDATFDRYPREARRVMAFHWLSWPFQWLGWLLVTGDENPEGYYPRLQPKKVLVTHCLDDKVVSGDFAKEIVQQLPHKEVLLWTFPICGHTGFFYFPRTQGKRKLVKLMDSIFNPSPIGEEE